MDKITEQNDTFFVVINSNDCLNFHKENNQSEFRIQYEKPFEFIRDMEVGLIEVNLPDKYIYKNVPKSEIKLVLEGKEKYTVQKFNINEKYLDNSKIF